MRKRIVLWLAIVAGFGFLVAGYWQFERVRKSRYERRMDEYMLNEVLDANEKRPTACNFAALANIRWDMGEPKVAMQELTRAIELAEKEGNLWEVRIHVNGMSQREPGSGTRDSFYMWDLARETEE